MEAEESAASSGKAAALVEANCEFLTLIRHNANERTQQARNTFKTVGEYMEDRKSRLNSEALLQLFVELTYFHYASRVFKACPVVAEEDIRVEECALRNAEKRFSLVVWYRMQEGELEEGEAVGKLLALLEYIRNTLAPHLDQRRGQRDKPLQEAEQEQAIDNFFMQVSVLASQLDYFRSHQAQFFQCLQQASIFYEYSLFYRIKNCSILDFIRSDDPRFSQLRISKVKDQAAVIQYNKEKTRGKSEQEYLRGKEKEIEVNIGQFFKAINPQQYQEIQPKNEKDQSYKVKFNYTIKERQKLPFRQAVTAILNADIFSQDYKQPDRKRPPCDIRYFIEYSSEKNHICVKLYNPSIVSNVQTSDFLIFQSNVLTFDPVNVSIELAEQKGEDERAGKKVVTFKGSSSFNVKEPPLQKILLLMDITLIASKIYEPELNVNRYGGSLGKDYQRLATVSNKVNHYTKMFLKLAKKVYSQ